MGREVLEVGTTVKLKQSKKKTKGMVYMEWNIWSTVG
jgi:hypothetical protein